MNVRRLVVGLGLVGISVGAVFVTKKMMASQASWEPAPVREDSKSNGPQNARVTVVEYSDFQCPACRNAQTMLKGFLTEYSPEVRLIFRHFPLAMHLWSGLAHQAAECAHLQGRFWDYHDRLFETQAEWSVPQHPSEKFLQFAKGLGLNVDQFAVCLTDKAAAEAVESERKKGEGLQVTSTPTFFIQGERVVGPVDLKVKGENIIRVALGLAPKEIPQPAPAPPSAPVSAPALLPPETVSSPVAPATASGPTSDPAPAPSSTPEQTAAPANSQ